MTPAIRRQEVQRKPRRVPLSRNVRKGLRLLGAYAAAGSTDDIGVTDQEWGRYIRPTLRWIGALPSDEEQP